MRRLAERPRTSGSSCATSSGGESSPGARRRRRHRWRGHRHEHRLPPRGGRSRRLRPRARRARIRLDEPGCRRFRAQFSDPLNIAIGLRSIEAFTRFAERPGGEIDLAQVGYLFLLDRDDVAAFEQSVALQNELGPESLRLTGRDRRALPPGESKAYWLRPTARSTGTRAPRQSSRATPPEPGFTAQPCSPAARRPDPLFRGRDSHGHDGRWRDRDRRCRLRGCVVARARADGRRRPPRPTRAARGRLHGARHGAAEADPADRRFLDRLLLPSRRTVCFFGMADRAQLPTRRADRPGVARARSRRSQNVDCRRSRTWVLPEAGRSLRGHTRPQALVGEAQDVSRFLYATGFSGHGFLQGLPWARSSATSSSVADRSSTSPLAVERFALAAPRPEHNVI